MANPLSGIINQEFKNLWANAIDALIEGCEVPCKLVYASNKYEDCTNCQGSPHGNRGPNPFINGGGGTHTNCPKCAGTRKIQVPNEESVNLIVIWDYKKYKTLAGAVVAVDGEVQTLCSIDLIEKIKDTTAAYMNTNIERLAEHKFVRDGEPIPHGIQEDLFILTNWKKS